MATSIVNVYNTSALDHWKWCLEESILPITTKNICVVTIQLILSYKGIYGVCLIEGNEATILKVLTFSLSTFTILKTQSMFAAAMDTWVGSSSPFLFGLLLLLCLKYLAGRLVKFSIQQELCGYVAFFFPLHLMP